MLLSITENLDNDWLVAAQSWSPRRTLDQLPVVGDSIEVDGHRRLVTGRLVDLGSVWLVVAPLTDAQELEQEARRYRAVHPKYRTTRV